MTKIHPMTGYPVPSIPWVIRMGGSTGYIGKFGYTRNGGQKMHKGVDWLADPLTVIYAAHKGEVLRAGFEQDNQGIQRNMGYGSRIVLQGDQGIETRYGHLLLQVYQSGMEVREGEVLGLLGRTGNVGPLHEGKVETHLHFEVRWNGEPVNPEWWLHGNEYEKFGAPKP